MDCQASAKNIRISPEKIRLVVAQIKKMPPQKAIQILGFVNKSPSLPLKKLIASAVANAKNNHGIAEEDLLFKEILVGKGPMYKRYQPVSRGRAHHILKRTSHIKIVLIAKQKESKPEVKKLDEKKATETKEQKEIKTPKTKGVKNGTKS